MKLAIRMVLLTVIACCVAGCWPKKFAWSPDGKQAVVIGSDGLYVCDGTGKLSPRLAAGEFWQPTWFADGSRFVVVKHDKITRWGDIGPAIGLEDSLAIEDLAHRLSHEIKSDGNWAGALSDSLRRQDINLNHLRLAILRLRDGMDPGTADKLAKWLPAPERSLVDSVWTVHIAQIKGATITIGSTIAYSVDPILDTRINGNGTLIAYTSGIIDNEPHFNIWIVRTNGSEPPKQVDHDVAIYPDWATDGRYLLYIRASAPESGDKLRLATLVRCGIHEPQSPPVTKPGRIESSGTRFAWDGVHLDRDEITGMVFSPWDEVRCMKDGRILFTSLEMTLPTTKADMPTRVSLFALDPDHMATIQRLIPRGAAGNIPEDAYPFEISPQGKWMAAVSGKQGVCIVLSLVTGDLMTIPVPVQNDPPILPAWRSGDELCVLAQPAAWGGKEGKPEFVLLSKGRCQVLSRDWPKTAMELWK